MDRLTIDQLLFYGASGILRPGATLPAGALVSADPAQALVQAWHSADQAQSTPFVYLVAATPDGAMAVVDDVPIDGKLAARALGIAERSRC